MNSPKKLTSLLVLLILGTGAVCAQNGKGSNPAEAPGTDNYCVMEETQKKSCMPVLNSIRESKTVALWPAMLSLCAYGSGEKQTAKQEPFSDQRPQTGKTLFEKMRTCKVLLSVPGKKQEGYRLIFDFESTMCDIK